MFALSNVRERTSSVAIWSRSHGLTPVKTGPALAPLRPQRLRVLDPAPAMPHRAELRQRLHFHGAIIGCRISFRPPILLPVFQLATRLDLMIHYLGYMSHPWKITGRRSPPASPSGCRPSRLRSAAIHLPARKPAPPAQRQRDAATLRPHASAANCGGFPACTPRVNTLRMKRLARPV